MRENLEALGLGLAMIGSAVGMWIFAVLFVGLLG